MTGRRLGGLLLSLALSGPSAPALEAKRLPIPLPPPGGVTIVVGTVQGKVRHLPKRFDFRRLVRIRKKNALPRLAAVYAAARLTKSGADVTLSLSVFVFNPRVSTSLTTRAFVDGSYARLERGARIGDIGKAFAVELDHLFDEDFKPRAKAGHGYVRANTLNERYGPFVPDDVTALSPFENPPGRSVQDIADLMAGLGSYNDGHAYGWKLHGSPSGANDPISAVEGGHRRNRERAGRRAARSGARERARSRLGLPAWLAWPGALRQHNDHEHDQQHHHQHHDHHATAGTRELLPM